MNKVNNKKMLMLILLIGILFIYTNAGMAAIQPATANVNGTTLTVNYDDLSVSEILFDDADSTDDIITVTAVPLDGFGFSSWQTDSGATIDKYTTATIEVDVAEYQNITPIFKKLYTLNINSNGNGSIIKSPNKAEYLKGEEVTITADPIEGYEFDSWSGDIASGQEESKSITITMDSDKNINANFVQGKITSFEIGPRHIVREIDIREFEFRPESVREGQEVPDDVTISFQFSANAPVLYVVNKNTGELIGDAIAGQGGNINYVSANEKLILTSSFLVTLEKDTEFEIRLGNQSNGPVLATFTIKDSFARPTIDVIVEGHPQYGTLESGRVYYLKEKANLEVDVDAQSDLMSQRYIRGYSSDIGPKSLDVKVELSGFDWKIINSTTNINQELNVNIADQDWRIDDTTPLSDAVNALDNGELEVIAVRMKAYATGARTHADETYYFAIDREDPDAGPGTNPDFENDVEFGIIHNNQLKVTFYDAISGIDPDSIEAQAIKVDDNNDLEEERKFYANYTNGQFETRAMEEEPAILIENDNIIYNEDTQTALLENNYFDEGNYVVRILAEDRAGNGEADPDEIGFTFSVTLNKDKPIINDMALRDDAGNDLGKVISNNSKDGSNLEFTIYNSEELRYQVRPVGGNWTQQTLMELDKKMEHSSQPLTGASGLFSELTDGDYEVIIVADDIELNPDILSYLENIAPNSEADIEEDVKNKLKEHLNLNDTEWEDQYSERMAIKAFRFKVDNTSPEIGENLEYYNSGNDQFEDIANQTISILRPLFRIDMSDDSGLRKSDIEIDINGGFAEVVSITDTYITFRPINSLEDGVQTVTIIAEDRWENAGEPQTFEFEFRGIDDDNLDIFTIDEGAELNVNEASLIEIDFRKDEKNKDLEITENLLKITINYKVIFENGEVQSFDYKVNTFDSDGNGKVERVVIFAKKPIQGISGGPVNIIVSAQKENEYSELYPQELNFTIKGGRKGFGFGRLLIEK
ncbi:InlB B-repeat-containing protein [Orenia marismortui]|uniref:InlB B-repeat-containing protein n=1 Tax=Orenia marismortui TaxID=46469 RepID=UPI0003814D3D|nr:InlB B-repeat-containing protein [Orenia marismortui]